MTYEEKRAWIRLVVNVAAYAAYVSIILDRANGLANTIYLSLVLSTVLASVIKVTAYRWGLPRW